MTVDDRRTLRSISQSDIGISSGVARAVLSLYGEHYPLPYYLNDQNLRYRSSNESEERSEGNNLSVVPNPTTLNASIVWSNTELSKGDLLIWDVNGNLILRDYIESNKPLTIDVSSFVAGIYFVVVYDGGKYIQNKLVVH